MPKPESGKQSRPLTIPKGWRRAQSNGQPVYLLEPSHPDYPTEIRDRAIAEDEARFGSDPDVQAALERLKHAFATIGQRIVSRADSIENGIRNPGVLKWATEQALNDLIRLVNAEDAQLGKVAHQRRRYAYLLRHAKRSLPTSVANDPDLMENLAPYEAPFVVMVNLGSQSAHPQIYPHETAIHLDRLASRDLTRLGRVLTEAQVLANQIAEPGKGGRPKLPDINDEAATPEMVAKLRHWEGWSYRRIAAFVGWLRPDEDWRNERVRRRVEQRVRRWVREGESILRAQFPDQDWKKRPPHVQRAVDEERPRV